MLIRESGQGLGISTPTKLPWDAAAAGSRTSLPIATICPPFLHLLKRSTWGYSVHSPMFSNVSPRLSSKM